MTPKEKKRKNDFFAKANTELLYGSAQRHVNPGISYATVVDKMHTEFTNGLGSSTPVSVQLLNQTTINNLNDSYKNHLKAVAHTRKVGFENSKIPASMLPRPSFNLQGDDEDIGKHQIVLR